MNCPKCNSVCRHKMTGAVCLNDKCGWYTDDREKIMANALVNKVEFKDSYESYKEAMEDLDKQGVVHLGWLNSGITVPKHINAERVYKNYSGSSTLMCDPIYRIAYSVDMGD